MMSVVLSFTFVFLILAGEGASGQQTIPQTCPSGWLQWENNFCYLFVNTSKVTWTNAEDECQDRRAQLLRIETLDEYNFVRKAWESKPSLINISEMYWTALNNLPMNEGAATTPVYMWGNDEFPLDTVVKANWDKEPDNTPFKNCVSVNVQGTMAMAGCGDRKPYICEYMLNKNEICPVSWIPSNDRKYCYKVSNATNKMQYLTWDEARKMCEGNHNHRGTTLLTIISKDVQNFLYDRLPSVYNGRKSFWTSLNDIDTEGKLMWAGNGGTPFTANTFHGWRQEPNNMGGNEHCGSLMPYGRWNDRNCDDALNFACRMPLATGMQALNFGCGVWRRAGNKCVHVYNTMKTWTDARKFCQSSGGDLLSFDSQTDADWLTMQAQNNVVQRRYPGYWIGLNDRQKEGTFVWADGSKAIQYILNWDHEPHNNVYCSVMSDGGLFSDFTCHATFAGSVCEEDSKTCAIGWIPYNGHCYKIVRTWLTFHEARDRCKLDSISGKGTLFALNSAQEKKWIMSQMVSPTIRGIPHRFWSSLVNRNGWVWANPADQDPVATQALVEWAHEPNNRNGEDCVEILANGALNDAPCQHTRDFICQKAPSQAFSPEQQTGNGSNAVVPVASLVSAIFVSLLAPVFYRLLL